jgi:two-component system NtrC family sensor kinase
MNKIFSLLFLSFLLFINTIAQNNLPPVYEIKSDSASIKIPDSCWQMLEDSDGKWTINQVSQSPLDKKFHSNVGINSPINTYWVRYRIKNNMGHEAKISFGNRTAYFDVFIKQTNDAWQHKKTGFFLPWSKRDGYKKFQKIPFVIEPMKEQLVYQRMKFALDLYPQKEINVGFDFTEKIIDDYYINNDAWYFGSLREAFFFGISVLAVIFCFFFFLTTHERVYFLASMLILSYALIDFQDPLRDVFFREYPWIRDYGQMIFLAFFLHFTAGTYRYAVDAKHLFPRLNKFLMIVSILPFLFPLAVVFNVTSYTSYFGFPIVAALILLSIIINSFKAIHKKNKTAQLLIAAVIFTAVYTTVLILAHIFNITLPMWLQKHDEDITLLCNCSLIIISSWILFERYKQMQKKALQEAFEKEQIAKEKEIERRQLIEQQKIELEKQVTERTSELKQSLDDLKSAQSQLIQSEKMASLGELTAGIAHEIQNPLNFVNNFSDVNTELIEEAKQEIDRGNAGDVKTILNNISDNEQKINHHGKRADAIVRGMLQHSRTSSGQKEPTDINVLADEYLRLAYHGMRARDKSFNAKFQTDFDNKIGKINIVPQDIGRVILNLINNAFYAVGEKTQQNVAGYEPAVSVNTKRLNGKVEIAVKDNGNGIPASLGDKIFQPFFTTKPTGQGTGLGLSLAYDIVKAHGGEIKVATKEGEGSQFIVQLPIQ